MDNETTYDDECIRLCNHLADLMQIKKLNSVCKDNDGKVAPPYGLVALINMRSLHMKNNISGRPEYWSSWVSPLAQDFTNELRKSNAPNLTTKFLMTKLEE